MARRTVTLSQADHERISAAIVAAERRSDGEIVPVVAPQSDAYHDVALHWAVLAMLAVPVKVALLPDRWIDGAATWLFGWNGAFTRDSAMLALLVMMALAFLAVRLLLGIPRLRMALTPGTTKTRRVRRSAIALFRTACENRTRGRTGILIYLSLAERRAEIVADTAIHGKVAPEVWGDAMATLIDAVRDGRLGDGMVGAIEAVGAVLAEHLPNDPDKENEMPDRVVEL